MRRTENEIKAELLKRRDRYVAKKKRIKNGIIAAVLCICMVAASVSVVFMLPDNGDTGDNVLDGSGIHTPFDSSAPNGSVEDEGANGSEETGEFSVEGESSVGEASNEENAESSDAQSHDEASCVIDNNGASVDDSVSQEPEYSPTYDKNVEVDMIYPEMPEDGISLNLLKTLSAAGVNGNPISYSFASAYGDFSAGFFKGCAAGQENALVSPLSMMMALSMAANGAAGETKWVMEKALGGFPIDELNKYLYTYLSNMPAYKTVSLSVKNAIWVKDGSGINKDFLQSCLDYYDADAYMAPFNNTTKDEINNWISENTGGDIKDMLKEISPNAMMYLVNALEFDAEWLRLLSDVSVGYSKTFTNADGSVTDVEYMFGCEDEGKYIETYNATGFIKDYEGNYSFVALLPKNENGLDSLVSSLSGSSILSILNGYKTTNIKYTIPKFSFSASVSSDTIKDTLSDMGMGLAFDGLAADFRRVHDDGAYIEDVFHDATIKVNCKGTRATAASIVVMAPPTGGGDPYPPPTPKEVVLNRPFAYMIVDRTTNMPIFMGTVTNMAKSEGGVAIDPVITRLNEGLDYDIPYVNDGVFGVDYAVSAGSCEEVSEDVSKEITEKTPEVIGVTVINSMEEFVEYCDSMEAESEAFDTFKNHVFEWFFYNNVLVIAEVDEPCSGKTYDPWDAYGYSDTLDSVDLVIEYKRQYSSCGSGIGGATFYLITEVSTDIYDQIDGVTIKIS